MTNPYKNNNLFRISSFGEDNNPFNTPQIQQSSRGGSKPFSVFGVNNTNSSNTNIFNQNTTGGSCIF
jgi:hypothetical protein